jgi:quercetin dioxygenase-like cupin family protein
MTHPYRIPFPDMAADTPAPHVLAKAATAGSHRLRLVEFRAGFEEIDWCRSPHTGYVLEGRLRIAFPAGEVVVQAGDGLYIPLGDAHRHKAIPLTDRVLLVLFEPA